MHIKILICYLLGCVNITVEGFFIERFINTCISKKIFFWNTQRNKSTVFSANIGIKNFKEVAKVAKKCQCKIKINNKSGLPFILNKYRKRKFFAISLIIIVAVIIVISNFIWNIEITGIDDENIKAEIYEIMKNEGICIGKYKKKVNYSPFIWGGIIFVCILIIIYFILSFTNKVPKRVDELKGNVRDYYEFTY